jgi:hypothetical protein
VNDGAAIGIDTLRAAALAPAAVMRLAMALW